MPRAPLSRRDLLSAGAAAAAGGLSLDKSVGRAEELAAGANTGDAEARLTQLRITALRPLPAGGRAYLRLETNQGITGWGELTGIDPAVGCALAASVFKLLDGQNPTRVEHLWQRLFRSHRDQRGGATMIGGISQLRKMATLAEAYSVPLAPHSAQSELGLSASLHATATVPHFLIHEAYLHGSSTAPQVAHKHFSVDDQGNASLPEGPGLGVDIDLAAIEKLNADPTQRFHWPIRDDLDGSVRDY